MLATIGLAAVLVYQLWSYFHEQAVRKTENKAAITVSSGRAEMLIWGQEKWVVAGSGGVLREGDSIHVFPDSRVSLALLNGGFVRLNSDTEADITELRTKDREDVISLNLTRGEAWLKKARGDAVKTSFSVSTDGLSVRTIGTIFNISKRDDTRTSVMEGKIAIDVKNEENGKVRVIDTVEVGVGQEAIISESSMDAFRKRENPEILFAIGDIFRGTEWYTWNMGEDVLASSVTVQEAVSGDADTELAPAPETVEPVEEISSTGGSIPSPVVVSPDENSRTSKESKVLIRGTTSEQTQKIVVSTFVGGKEDSYALQKYSPGSIEWSYIASTDLGNYVPGSNRYEIIAVDKDGKESEKTVLNLFYEKEKEPADLSAPTVTAFNSQPASGNTYETCSEPILIEGKIGKGIVKVVVNGFTLTRYVPNSTAWSYKVQSSFGNLKEGENEYEVYGADSDGTKTPVMKFSITKCATPPPTPPADTSNSTVIDVSATEAPQQ